MNEVEIPGAHPKNIYCRSEQREYHCEILLGVYALGEYSLFNLNSIDKPADDDNARAHNHHRNHHRDGQHVHQRCSRDDDRGTYTRGNDVENFGRNPEFSNSEKTIGFNPVPSQCDRNGKRNQISTDGAVHEILDFFHPRIAKQRASREVLHAYAGDDVEDEISDAQLYQPSGCSFCGLEHS